MENYSLSYKVKSGWINDWLMLGPTSTPINIKMTNSGNGVEEKNKVISTFTPATLSFDAPPIQSEKVIYHGKDYFWKLVHGKQDNRLEMNLFSHALNYFQVWAYCCIISQKKTLYSAALTTGNAATVWLNGRKTYHSEAVAPLGFFEEACHKLEFPLESGENHIWLLLEDVSINETVLSAQLQIEANAPRLKVELKVFSRDVDYWLSVEDTYSRLTMDPLVSPSTRAIVIKCPHDSPRSPHVTMRVRTPTGRIYGEFLRKLDPGDIVLDVNSSHLPPGDLEVQVMPPPEDYYHKNFRVSRSIPFSVSKEKFFAEEEIPYEQRLLYVAQKAAGGENFLSEYAKMKLNWAKDVDPNIIKKEVDNLRSNGSTNKLNFLNLLAVALCLLEKQEELPELMVKTITLASFAPIYPSIQSELDDLYSYTNQLLAGQVLPDTIFNVSGLLGKDLQNQGDHLVTHWIQEHSWNGFTEWNPDLDQLLPPLLLLAEYSNNEHAREFATVFIDKLLFFAASTSWKGCPNPLGRKVNSSQVKSARFHSSASLGMLLWGAGCFNECQNGAAYLALSNGYVMPDIIRSIAQDNHSNVRVKLMDSSHDSSDPRVVQTVFKTPDYMLASAHIREYGKRGLWEHLWQAVLDPEAIVFTNMPASSSQSESRPLSYWNGNFDIPNIAQWQDSLICMYNPSVPPPLGFTHAYFPLYAFDEHIIEGKWAFARKADSYIALFAPNGLKLIKGGDDANRELRSCDSASIWCCQMGSKSQDKSYKLFCQSSRKNPPQVENKTITWHTIRNDVLVMSWDNALRVNGQEIQKMDNKQFESPFGEAPYPAVHLDLKYQENILRLNFGS